MCALAARCHHPTSGPSHRAQIRGHLLSVMSLSFLGVVSSWLTQWTNGVCEQAGFELVTLSLRGGRAGRAFQETITLDLGRQCDQHPRKSVLGNQASSAATRKPPHGSKLHARQHHEVPFRFRSCPGGLDI